MKAIILAAGMGTRLGEYTKDLPKCMLEFAGNGVESLKSIYHENRSLYYGSDKEWLRSTSFKKGYMTCMLQAIINEGHAVQPITVRRGWLEFDNVEDYERYSLWNESGQITDYIKITEVI